MTGERVLVHLLFFPLNDNEMKWKDLELRTLEQQKTHGVVYNVPYYEANQWVGMFSFQGVFSSEEKGYSDVWAVQTPLSFASLLTRSSEIHDDRVLSCYGPQGGGWM